MATANAGKEKHNRKKRTHTACVERGASKERGCRMEGRTGRVAVEELQGLLQRLFHASDNATKAHIGARAQSIPILSRPWHISINILLRNCLLGVHLGRGGVEGAPRGRWGVARGRIVDEEQRGRLRAVVWGGSAGGDSPAPPLGSREQRRPRLCSRVHLLLPAHPLLRALPSFSDASSPQ